MLGLKSIHASKSPQLSTEAAIFLGDDFITVALSSDEMV